VKIVSCTQQPQKFGLAAGISAPANAVFELKVASEMGPRGLDSFDPEPKPGRDGAVWGA
jgi:hypothetical protein